MAKPVALWTASDDENAIALLESGTLAAEDQEKLLDIVDRRRWVKNNVVTKPQESSRLKNARMEVALERAQLAALDAPIAGMGQQTQSLARAMPKTVADLPDVAPDSREAILAREEQRGLNTLRGLDGIGANAKVALRLNNTESQRKALAAAVLDKYEAAGVDLPEGMSPVYFNPDLGAMEFVVPREDGKLERVLVEPEALNVSSIGQLADLEEGMAGVFAGLASVAGGPAARHPFVREFLGDQVGRNVGIALEAMLNANETTPEDLAAAFSPANNVQESFLNTAISRGMFRAGRFVTGGKKATDRFVSGSEGRADVQANIGEAADTLEAINSIIAKDVADGDVLPFTLETGSVSQRGAQTVNARFSTLSPTAADNVEILRRERIKSLSAAARRTNSNAAPTTSPDYVDYDVIREANDMVVKERGMVGQITTGKVPNTDLTKYYFYGDTPREASKGVLVGENVRRFGVDVRHTEGTTEIINAFEGQNFKGQTNQVIFHVMDEAAERGDRILIDRTRSDAAEAAIKNWKERGFVLETLPDGRLEVIARPGELVSPQFIANAEFQQEVLESGIEGVNDLLMVSQSRADDASSFLKDQIGWSAQRQASDYTVENKANSVVRTTVRRLQNRINNALTGAEATEANRVLQSSIRSSADEEGNTVLAGLAGEQLDLGQLLNARAKLKELASSTKDPDLIRLVQGVDNLIKNSPYTYRSTGRARPAQRAGILDSLKRADEAQASVDELAGLSLSSKIFKTSPDGQLVNTSLDRLGVVLTNTNFMKDIAPILRFSPDIASSAREGVSQLYKQKVLGGSGWTRTKHDNFVRRYSDAIDSVYDDTQKQMINSIEPPRGEFDRFDRANQVADRVWKSTIRRLVPDGDMPIINNPKDIVASFNRPDVGPSRVDRFMRDLTRLDPQMSAKVKSEVVNQTQRKFDQMFFNMDRTPSVSDLNNLSTWWNDNRAVLQAVHGNQYVADMDQVVRAARLDARREVLKGNTPPSQSDLIRVTRSILGPLSKPQRQITAGNYLNQKRMARRVLNIYSDPEKLRLLSSQGSKFGARTAAGIAVAQRLGLFEAVGIVPPVSEQGAPLLNDPEFRKEVNQFYNSVDGWWADTKAQAEEDKE